MTNAMRKRVGGLFKKVWGKAAPRCVKARDWPYLTLAVCVGLTGCTTTQQTPPDIGTGTDDLKSSVCEGCALKPFYKNGQWLIKR